MSTKDGSSVPWRILPRARSGLLSHDFPRVASLGGPAGLLADSAGWDTYYVVSFVMGLPGIALVWLMRERIRGLDSTRNG